MDSQELSPSAIDYILANVQDDDPKLNQWERDFILSVSDQWHRRRTLTDKQIETLGKIWDKI
jgi:hypothetical protein